MALIEPFCGMVILVDTQSNWPHTVFLIDGIDYCFQDFATDALSTVSAIDHKTHESVERPVFHFFRIGFPWNSFT